MKYLEFLTGSHLNLALHPDSALQIRRSHSSTLFDLKHVSTSVTDDTDIMLDLIRQEDGRGEKPVKKLRHKMKRFTHSSRTMLNEKYNAFMRKFGDSGDSKSPGSTSLSLSSLFTSGGIIKEKTSNIGSSERSSMFDMRQRPSFKAKYKVTTSRPTQRYSLKRTAHPIVRSMSEDSSMKNNTAITCRPVAPPNIASISEYSDSTHSSPIIFAGEKQPEQQLPIFYRKNDYNDVASGSCGHSESSSCVDVVSRISGYHSFGEFKNHAPHCMRFPHESATVKSYSTNSILLLNSESSSSEAEFEENNELKECKMENAKMAKYIKICGLDANELECVDDKWIRPSELESTDDGLPEFQERRSLLCNLKTLSHHVQGLLSEPKKEEMKTINANSGDNLDFQQPFRIPPKTLTLSSPTTGDRKSYYSSQPEMCIDLDADMLITSSTQLTHSHSLINLPKLADNYNENLSIAPNLKIIKDDMYATNVLSLSDAGCSTAFLPLTLKSFASKCPVLRICPSTPTPSETDLKLNFNNHNAAIVAGEIVSKISDIPTPALSSSTETVANRRVPQQLVNDANTTPLSLNVSASVNPSPLICNSPSPPSLSPKHYLSTYSLTYTNNNHGNNMNTSLLVPLSSSSAPQLCINNRYHRHHRSLNEINCAPVALVATASVAATAGASGVTDSPSLKRFGPPAQAAVVAAAAVPNATAIAAVPSSASMSSSNRSKLSPSPSKLTVNIAATSATPVPTVATGSSMSNNAVATLSQMECSSSASTSSTQTSTSMSTSTATNTASTVVQKDEMCRRSSDSDLSVTPKGNSLCVASERLVAATAMMRLSQPITSKAANTDGMDGMMEYPFLTMTKYPPGFILHLGATVAARSVKLLERVPNPDEPEVRDSWWTELRMEIRSHARALGCNVVLGYSEATTISDDVCVLSATGTAAVINMAYNRSVSQTDILTTVKPSSVAGTMSASLEDRDTLKDTRNGAVNEISTAAAKDTSSSLSGSNAPGKKNALLNMAKNSACNVCHVPYNLSSVPFNVKMKKCGICRKGRVPDVLLATLEVPEYLHVTGRGCFMQAQVVRAKKDLRSELNAKEISDGLPFLEYELHRVLINKLKAKGMNAIFGLKAQVAIGERMIALIATGTALFLTALPMPQVPKIVAGNSWTDKQKLNELQKKLQETFERNQEVYQLKCMDPDLLSGGDKQSDTDESDDEIIEIDLNCGNKDTCVLEVDDIEDLEIISLLMESYPPEGFHVVNTQNVPGMLEMDAVKNLQMFTQVWRAKLDVNQNISGFPKHFQRLLQTIYFKLRTMIPCAICDLRFRLDLPESDQIQLLVTGMALGLGDANKFKYRRKAAVANGTNANDTNISNAQVNIQSMDVNGIQGNKRTLQEEDYIFPLDEDQIMVDTPTPTSNLPPYGLHSFKLAKTSPSRQQSKANAVQRNRYFPLRDRYGVDITPLSFIPGGRIEKYLGNLNFFFIRETTSIRETGGISGFVHSFITELLAVVRAHISALGGNAMVSFYMSELILVDNQHKNQGQCLISIGGDAVYVSYHTDD